MYKLRAVPCRQQPHVCKHKDSGQLSKLTAVCCEGAVTKVGSDPELELQRENVFSYPQLDKLHLGALVAMQPTVKGFR